MGDKGCLGALGAGRKCKGSGVSRGTGALGASGCVGVSGVHLGLTGSVGVRGQQRYRRLVGGIRGALGVAGGLGA